LGHDLDLSRSRDVIGYVAIWFPGSNFLYVLHWHQVRIRITWRHQPRGHSNLNGPFPTGAPLSPSRYLPPFSRYWALSIWGSRPNWLQANCPDFFTKDQWPPNSPDLNPLEYRMWCTMLEAYRKLKTKLKTIAGPHFRLSGATCHMDRSTRLWKDFSKWLFTCVGNGAGHFEHSLWQ